MKTSIAIFALAALAAVGSIAALSPASAAEPNAFTHDYIPAVTSPNGQYGEMNDACGPGQWHVQDVGGVLVCTPAALGASETNVIEPGRWVPKT
jgi:hypothetical protein